MRFFRSKHISSFQIIIVSFLLAVMVGCLLLMLPMATRGDGGATFSEALFTATSSVCVTGLVVQDTASYWSLFGQMVILLLIQTGGMGIVTIAVFIAIISGRKIGLMQRSTMQEAISAPQVGGIVRLTKFILLTAVGVELTGMMVLLPAFVRDFGISKGIWYALFHSVSAFCNAGFDLMGIKSCFSSLTGYSGHMVVNLAVMSLIIIGGIGFLTWEDIGKNKFYFRKYRMQSKVILSVSLLLILLPALYFFFFEFSDLPPGERVLVSLFQSVTTRTAGFNSVDLNTLHDSGKGLMTVLMLIGGSPGSTAGGMKTTTAAVLAASAISVFRRQGFVSLFKRSIPMESIQNAAAILLMYLMLFLAGGGIISYMEDLPILDCLFESASAIGTVGLTLGITAQLGWGSRIILILLMFFGRVGGLTLIFAAVSDTGKYGVRFPKEKITVG